MLLSLKFKVNTIFKVELVYGTSLKYFLKNFFSEKRCQHDLQRYIEKFREYICGKQNLHTIFKKKSSFTYLILISYTYMDAIKIIGITVRSYSFDDPFEIIERIMDNIFRVNLRKDILTY